MTKRGGNEVRRETDELGQVSNCKVWKSMLDVVGFRRQDITMLFPKDTPLLLRAAATVSLGIAMLLVVVPCIVLFFAVSPEPVAQHLRLFELPVACWAAWALVSLWAALDSSRLWRVFGRPVDPLGNHALWGVLLGILNVGASVLVVALRRSH